MYPVFLMVCVVGQEGEAQGVQASIRRRRNCCAGRRKPADAPSTADAHRHRQRRPYQLKL